MPDASSQHPVYQSWSIDSRRWRHYRPRDSDIIIGTYPKCGTTWMQRIVDLLVFQSPQPRPINEVSPWIDGRVMAPMHEVMQRLDRQVHRRFIKSHVPFDALPHHDPVRYIHVARDGRDACMSYFNHCSAFTPEMYARQDAAAADMGAPAPRCPDDVRVFFHNWLTRGVQPGSSDGYPILSFFNFETTWWAARTRDNVLLVHYNDLKANLDGEMRRIARFLSIEPDPAVWDALVAAATFNTMKEDSDALLPKAGTIFEGGARRFIYKGVNGRWHGKIPPQDQALYAQKAAARFTPGLARWLENGRLVTSDPEVAPD